MIEVQRTALVDEELKPTGTYLGIVSEICPNCHRLVQRPWNLSNFDGGQPGKETVAEFKHQEDRARDLLAKAMRQHDCGPRI